MKKKLCELTKEDIGFTCARNSNNFMGACNKNCPFYIETIIKIKRHIVNCKTDSDYIKKFPNEEIDLEG